MNDEGKAEFYAESDDALVQEAMDSCPVSAISEEQLTSTQYKCE